MARRRRQEVEAHKCSTADKPLTREEQKRLAHAMQRSKVWAYRPSEAPSERNVALGTFGCCRASEAGYRWNDQRWAVNPPYLERLGGRR